MTHKGELITFIGSGRYSDVFRISNGRHSVIMKLSYYRDNTLDDFIRKTKSGDVEGAKNAKNKDSIMVSSAIAAMTNGMLATTSPHFVRVYCHADCRNFASRLSGLIPNRMKTSTKLQLKYNNVSFMEPFTADMTKWMRGSSKSVTDHTVRNAIFGVLYTLSALQKAHPGFRHNDLSTNNVLVKKLRSPIHLGYRVGNVSYVAADMPVLVAINDYDFAHAPGSSSLSNERILGGKYQVTAAPNRTYDTHFFIKSVLKNILTKRREHLPETRAFIKSLPLEREDRLDKKQIRGLEPETLLKHRYFDPLVRKNIPRGVPTYTMPPSSSQLT